MTQAEVQKALERFRNYIVSQARSNLSKGDKNVSKKLYQSIKGDVKAMPNSISMEFSMEEYGYYQDKGVKGKDSSMKAPDSPFRFGTGSGRKGGLTEGIERWVQRRKIQFKNKDGKFMSYKSTAFIITRSVYSKGIKSSLFFTKPFEAAYKNLPDELINKFGLDAEKELLNKISKIKK
jgi:hypothetical protein